MNTSNKISNIEKESLELVLDEFAEEQRLHNKTIADLVSAVNSLTERIKEMEKRLESPQSITVSADTRPIQEIVKKGFIDTRLAVGAQSKNVTRKFQILLFPEQDAKLFYKVVFGRWFLWLVIMLFLTYLYKFSTHWSENRSEIQRVQEENNSIRKAWNQMYSQSGNKIKRIMDSVYYKNQ